MSSRTAASGLLVALVAPIAVSACSPRTAPIPVMPIRLAVGDTMRVTPRMTRVAGTTASYTSREPGVAQVNSAGRITAIRPGTTTITTTAPGRTPTTVVVVVTPRRDVNMLINEVCPNQDHTFFTDSAPISSALPHIHEFHDCQRLIIRDSYRSLIGVFAHANDTLPASAFRAGLLAALIINFRTKNETRTPADDTLTYGQLDLAPGTNCLILRSQGEQRWEAAVVHQKLPVIKPTGGVHYENCRDDMTWNDVPAARQGKLVVQLQTGVDLKGDPIVPPVARWDWDSNRGHNYIGVKCGTAWCEIGPPGFTQSIAKRQETTGGELIKGYYDEQYLADATGRRSNVFGTITPGRDAWDNTRIQRNGHWYHVAQMSVALPQSVFIAAPQAFDHYRGRFKLNVSSGVMQTGTGRVEIMARDEWGEYSDFAVRINGASGPNWRMVFRHHPEAVNKTPTARWRWIDADETTWSWCPPDGCCEKSITAFAP